MISLSEDYKKSISNMFPGLGEEWLKKIPLIAEKYIKKYNLQNVKVLENLTYNTILFAESTELGKIVMKIEIPFKEMTIRESEALKINNGMGACKCLFSDIDDGVVILERLTPGYTLSTINDIDEKIKIFRTVSNNFNVLIEDECKKLPTYKEILMRSKEIADLDREKYANVMPLLDEAIDMYSLIEKNNNCNYLLHSDLYSENIIKSGDAWKAIDPHGFIGPEILDKTIFIQKELGDTNFNMDSFNNLAIKMCNHCNKNYDELLEAFFVNYVLNICWDLEVNLSEEHINKSIDKAYLIKRLIKNNTNNNNKKYELKLNG